MSESEIETQSHGPTDTEIRTIASAMKVLGDPTRLRIVYECLDGPVSVSDIADRVGATPSLVSHHMRPLRLMRILRDDRKGKEIYYSYDDEHIQDILRNFLVHLRE